MNTHRQICQQDTQLSPIQYTHPHKDTNHVQRRQQQRAINDDMIQIAIHYGRKTYNNGAVIYTLSDRTLKQSSYAKFTDTLRGLRVVCRANLAQPILTAYWDYTLRQRVRY